MFGVLELSVLKWLKENLLIGIWILIKLYFTYLNNRLRNSKNPKKYSQEFNDLIDKCLRKDPKDRLAAKELLHLPFVLKGSSSQILPPLIKECKPLLLTRKIEALKGEAKEHEVPFLDKGTLLTLDPKTQQADIIRIKKLESDTNLNSSKNVPTSPPPRLNRASLIIQRIRNSSLSYAVGVFPILTPVEPEDIVDLPRSAEQTKIFGVLLEKSPINEPSHVFNVLSEYISKSAIDREGIMSIPGDSIKVKEIKQQFDAGIAPNLDDFGAHEIASTLLLYLYELPEPLLTKSRYMKFLDSIMVSDPETRLTALKTVINDLPPTHKKVLQKLLELCRSIASYAALNEMNPARLARALTPIFIQKDASDAKILKETPMMKSLLKTMITQYNMLF